MKLHKPYVAAMGDNNYLVVKGAVQIPIKTFRAACHVAATFDEWCIILYLERCAEAALTQPPKFTVGLFQGINYHA